MTFWAPSTSSVWTRWPTPRCARSARASAGWSRGVGRSWATRGNPPPTGAMTILVDHDMSLVSSCCENTAVLDFGKMIASGPTAEVLRNEQVVRAYLGAEADAA